MFKTIVDHLKKVSRAVNLRIATAVLFAGISIIAIVILMLSVNNVTIVSGDNIVTLKSSKTEVGSLLKLAGYSDNTYVLNSAETNGRNININITPTFPVYVTHNSTLQEVTFAGGTVSEVLTLAGIALDEHDIVSLSTDTVINDTAYIDVVNVDYETFSYTENNIIVTCQKKLVNGDLVETQVLSEKKISTSVSSVSKDQNSSNKTAATSSTVSCISTLKPSSVIELDANNVPVKYVKHITTTATAYTYTGNNCSTGVAPQPGYIAVNPNFIPYGTKMFIKSSDGKYIYGYAVAADTGGFIKKYPYNVDLFMVTNSQCVNFGRRSVEIYILE